LEFVNQAAGTMEDREYDLLLSCGEIISAVTITTLLQNAGHRAIALTGGQAGLITDDYHKNAELLTFKTEALKDYIDQDIIPVIAGFQGMTLKGEVTTIGRGGSDTTAAMVGAALQADRVEIFTDVDGIMTADPRVCEKASIIPAISYNESFQMADSGAKVIHPRAVEYAMRANIPLVVKNTFTDAPGTYIIQSTKNITQTTPPKVITGIAHRNNRIQILVENKHFESLDVLEQVANARISIDLINIFPTYSIFTIGAEDKAKLTGLLDKEKYTYTLTEGCSKVTAIGERMTGVPGVMARIIKALTKQHIEILQTADSLTTIGCLIKEESVSKAIAALHEEFNL
jgi:aspartate kinase